MNIKLLKGTFSVCKVKDYSQVNHSSPFCFIQKTDEENSLVCLNQDIPNNAVAIENGFSALRIEGILDFSLIGILSQIAQILAQNNIAIFVISTYQTDYIFIKQNQIKKAIQALSTKGYQII